MRHIERIENHDLVKVRVRTGKMIIAVAAGLSFLLSIYLYFSGDKQAGIFVGLWVPSILSAAQFILHGGSYG